MMSRCSWEGVILLKIGGSRSLKVGSRRAGVVSCSSSLSVSAAKLLRRSTGEGVVLAVGFAVFLGKENSSSSSLEGSASDSEGVLDLSEGVLCLDWARRSCLDRPSARMANFRMKSTSSVAVESSERNVSSSSETCRAGVPDKPLVFLVLCFPSSASSQDSFFRWRLVRDILLEATAVDSWS